MTTATTDLLAPVSQTLQALGAHYDADMQRVYSDAGLERQHFGLLAILYGADPEPMLSTQVQRRAPYLTLSQIEARLESGSRLGFFEPSGQAYRLTDKGRRTLSDALQAAWQRLAALELLPPDDMQRLAGLLKRVVEASLAAPEPAEKLRLVNSRRIDPGEGASVAARVDQYLTDLLWFRDDVHPAAWRRYGVDGPAWEIFTSIWRAEADSLDSLQAHLAGRGHAPEVFKESLDGLVRRGWIAEQDGSYSATEQGAALRQQAEETTDRLYYAPWACLNDAETEELLGLLARLRERLGQIGNEHTG
jgi:DNA-binding MarR family transcriptional regulator